MSDLSYEEEKEIYDGLLKAYPFPEWVVVWRGDRTKGAGYNTNEDWFFGYAPFDFVIYKNEDANGNKVLNELPPDKNKELAKQAFQKLKSEAVEDIVVEAKGRNFKDYTGIYINNHLPEVMDIDYYPYTNKIPDKNTPEDPKGKLNKVLSLLQQNNNKPVYYINKDKGKKDRWYIIKLTDDIVKTIKGLGVWEQNENPARRERNEPDRWEKNYNIFWDFISKYDVSNPGKLNTYFNTKGFPVNPVAKVYDKWLKEKRENALRDIMEKRENRMTEDQAKSFFDIMKRGQTSSGQPSYIKVKRNPTTNEVEAKRMIVIRKNKIGS